MPASLPERKEMRMNEGNNFRFDLWIYNEMIKRNWDAIDLSVESGLSVTTINHYLRDDYLPTMYSLALILKAFNMHMVFEDN